jgi:hypothetical protein
VVAPGDGPGPVSALALVLVELDGVPDKLLANHTRDDRGYCAGCALPQGGRSLWPCTLYAAARAAQRIARHRR